MKRGLFIFVLCVFAAAPALADLGDVTRISLQTTTWTFYGETGGGEFHATVIGLPLDDVGPVGLTWETFCMERSEHVGGGTNNYYGVLNTAAVQGGSGGGVLGENPIYGDPDGQPSPNTGDPLDPMTAYLYAQFATGVLSNYDFGGTVVEHKADAAALQNVFWKIEEEITSALTGQALAWYNEAVEATTLGADDKITWDGIGNVRLLNLYTGYDANLNKVSGKAQDMLVMVNAPIPGAVLLGLLGLGAAGARLRRRSA